MSAESVVAAPSLVGVTGANGFIGSHIVRELLAEGYRVRAIVRDPDNTEKTAHLVSLAEEMGAASRLEFGRGDLLEPQSFDDAMGGLEGLCHCAAAVTFAAKDPQRGIVDPSVEGTLNVLKSAAASATIRRVVHTSSVAAVYGWNRDEGHVFDEGNWNTSSTLRSDPYGLAKVQAERASLDFVAALPEGQRFELVHLNPGVVWGPPMTKAHCKASPQIVRDIVSRSKPGVPRLMLSWVDVRDVAQLHRLALTEPSPPARCIVSGGDVWMKDLAHRLQGLFPQIKMATRVIPTPLVLAVAMLDANLNARQLWHLLGQSLPMKSTLSQQAYGLVYRSLDACLRDTVEPMLSRGWVRTA